LARKINILLAAIIFASPLFAQTVANVKVLKAGPSNISEIVEGHGVIKPLPSNDVKISSASPLRIENIFVKPGDRVKKGELVVKLQRDHSIDLAVKKSKINLQYARINYERAQNLFKKGVIAKIKLETAKTNYELAKSEYNLQMQSFDYAVANSELRSPIDGVVSSINGVIGQIADPAIDLVHIVNMNEIIAVIGIESEDIAKVKVGQKADITIPNVTDGKYFKGEVVRKNREIDPATQLAHIWIKIEHSKISLQPGMFAEAKIFVKTDENIIALPRSAVLNDKNGAYVFTVNDNVAKKIYVKTGIKNANKIEILSGVNKGDIVVYLGNYELEDGMDVKVQE
jgi:membrane fusion protein (multidrug efflux system)